MRIYIVDRNKVSAEASKYAGETKNGYIVPQIGSRINCGYNPPPTVTDIVVSYKDNTVMVLVDGPVMEV